MKNLSRRNILSGGAAMAVAGVAVPVLVEAKADEINQAKLKALVACLRQDDQVICACYLDRQLIADFLEDDVMHIAHTPRLFCPPLPRAPEKLRIA